jgi:hypothetical protein
VKPPRANYSVQLNSPTPWLIAAWACLAMAAIIALLTANFVSRSIATTATVVKLAAVSAHDDGKTYYAPEYSFIAQDGGRYAHVAHSSSNPPAYTIGQVISVRYDKANPENSKINSFWNLWGFPILAGLSGGGFAVLARIMNAAKRRKKSVPAFAVK